ncbi:protein FAM246C-like [Gavia stellata]|uniref:protein FAM246C-like n=1 Tax=Gavia stellata TaxID=37040 RepID=UPI00289EDCF2|nr:protein FAM246C-like [Gavia stellata]
MAFRQTSPLRPSRAAGRHLRRAAPPDALLPGCPPAAGGALDWRAQQSRDTLSPQRGAKASASGREPRGRRAGLGLRAGGGTGAERQGTGARRGSQQVRGTRAPDGLAAAPRCWRGRRQGVGGVAPGGRALKDKCRRSSRGAPKWRGWARHHPQEWRGGHPLPRPAGRGGGSAPGPVPAPRPLRKVVAGRGATRLPPPASCPAAADWPAARRGMRATL